MQYCAFFNNVAHDYDIRVAPCRVLQVKALVYELNLAGHEKVLDVGCGSGLLSLEVIRHLRDGGQFTGIDMSPNMLDLCRRKLTSAGYSNFTLAVGDSLALDFADGTFDIIVSSNVIPFVGDQDRFVHEIRRVLKPGGVFGLISLHTDVYKEIYAVLDNVRTVHPDCFGRRTVHEDIGVKLEGIADHYRRLAATGFEISRGFVFETAEPTDANEYLERFNAATGEMYLASTPGDKKDFVRGFIRSELERRNGSLTVTESINLIIAHRAA